MFAGDLPFWNAYAAEVESTFRGECWTSCRTIDRVNYVEAVDEPGISDHPRRIHRGGNSGYQAVGLAHMFGAREIVLLGFDMMPGQKGEMHHHEPHDRRDKLHNPTESNLREWARRFIQAGIDLRSRGVRVVNCSRRTALTCFEQAGIEDALRLTRAGVGNLESPRRRIAAVLVPAGLVRAEHDAIVEGLERSGYSTTDENLAGADVAVVWGARDQAKASTVIVAENGYVAAPGRAQVALAIGGHNGSGRQARRSQDRFGRLGVDLKPWREHGEHILLCPSRGLRTAAMRQPDDWIDETVEAIKRYTDRPIRLRRHPGNWKTNPPAVPIEHDLENAWATVIWASSAGVRSLIEGVPVLYRAPHWICSEAAGNDLSMIESPPMPDRLPAFERMAGAQWSLDEIRAGDPFRELLGGLTVLCVLRSGGDYTPDYVRRLRDGVARNLTIPHRFVCLSDVDVPCERIPLRHNWPGWWSKIEIFRPDVVTGPTLYLDLDTVIVDNIDRVALIDVDFAMLNIREKDVAVGNSGAMWLARPFPSVYQRFAEKPDYWIDFHVRNAHDRYMGDQAFISDSFDRIPKLNELLPDLFKSYKYDRCRESPPAGCAVVCFGGHPRPHEASGWVRRVWV